MGRRLKMSLSEAMVLFGINSEDNVTRDTIGKTFRRLCFSVHTDKNKSISNKESGEKIGKFTEAKKVLLENFEAIPKTEAGDVKPDSIFVDYIKTVDVKNRQSPFTIYKKGKGR